MKQPSPTAPQPRTLALLALAGALSRLPFVTGTPINWDAVQLALALDRFSLHDHQPHPPGYILYVLLGRALHWLVADPSLALSLLSVLFTALSLPLLYLLALSVTEDRAVSLGAAILLLSSPLALYYGAVGLTYVPEMAASIGVAWLAWCVRRSPAMGAAAALGLTLGLAAGLRQTALVVLLPLCLWGLWRTRRGRWIAFGGTFIATCAAWLVPLLALSGGVGEYLRESALLAEAVAVRTSPFAAGLDGLWHNLSFMGLATALGLAFGLVPLGLWAARLLRFSLSPTVRDFLLWWTLPALFFYALTHVGQYGYLLVTLPPLLMLAALCARVWGERVATAWPGWSGGTAAVAICAVLALPAVAYSLLAPGPITVRAIALHDLHWRYLRTALEPLDPAQTVLMMGAEWSSPFRLAGYALPQFHSYAIGSDTPGGNDQTGWLYSAHAGRSTYALPRPRPQPTLPLPPNTHRVVALDTQTAEMLRRGETGTISVSLPNGITLYILDSPDNPITTLSIEDGKMSVTGDR